MACDENWNDAELEILAKTVETAETIRLLNRCAEKSNEGSKVAKLMTANWQLTEVGSYSIIK